MPILKQLVSSSSQTKRRSRMDLTREMISAPLGDFRHTMHVGRSGDAFGDTSFLSTRSGEPPPETTSFPRSPRPGLLSRTFRSSKRSQSVTRVDEHGDGALLAPGGSPAYVKNAMSLPFLNDENRGDGMGAKSLSSSPFKSHDELDGRDAAAHFLELEERRFGELTELPESSHPHVGGMKRADSVMSFHVDLGPSMLGDILGVMEKEDDDLGYEEGKSSEGRASPPCSQHGEEEEEDSIEPRTDADTEEQTGEDEETEDAQQQASLQPAGSIDLRPEDGGPYTPEYTPEIQPKHLKHLDSCSMSSSGSAALDEKPNSHIYAADTDSATFSAPPEEESNFSSFLEDEDDEIRV
ncbi:cdc42 effector protein 4a [Salarias fasciatus]|uniref:Cdc42 effector protein 4-like n=1 Tax=Salarias fasciatus TaxID=181472 RepID=A0A672J2L1_SALFA|nr:cdc42 effector protein 4-like [Salarias fasciatus]XP_029946169.1 cdc42 effector protein 4-like [Salarias fasciatus]